MIVLIIDTYDDVDAVVKTITNQCLFRDYGALTYSCNINENDINILIKIVRGIWSYSISNYVLYYVLLVKIY